MLDTTRLTTPPDHNDVLVEPAAHLWRPAARRNHDVLDRCQTVLCGRPLNEWRRATRRRICGTDDALVIVTGHQPEFLHPGVWAKYVSAAQMARAANGVALNLVVDSDVVKQTRLAIPRIEDARTVLEYCTVPRLTAGRLYEQIPRAAESELATFHEEVCHAMSAQYAESAMPVFFEGMAGAASDLNWVGQMLSGRRAVDLEFGFDLRDVRVSEIDFSPLMMDMLVNVGRFGAAYNAALANYRRREGIRDVRRPMPDLASDGGRNETALWAYRGNDGRRRVFVESNAGLLRLFAERDAIGVLTAADIDDYSADRIQQQLGGWNLRPRALTLTIWARLLLADWFIHGIGGARYDTITDDILQNYYGVEPPRFACVSATLRLDRAEQAPSSDEVRQRRWALRDAMTNPQRHFPNDPEVAPYLAERAAAVAQSRHLAQTQPKHRTARRAAYERIHAANQAIQRLKEPYFEQRRADIETARQDAQSRAIATGREYFFALHTRQGLRSLCEALPAGTEFGL